MRSGVQKILKNIIVTVGESEAHASVNLGIGASLALDVNIGVWLI